MQIIDISAPLTDHLVTWPGDGEGFVRTVLSDLDAGDDMTVSGFRLGAHAGTHVDAPCHFLAGAGGIETLPADALVGDAVVVSVPDGVDVVTSEVLDAAQIPADAQRILLATRNSGWTTGPPTFREDYVSCDESAAHWFLGRGIRLVAVDYLSVEPYHADAIGYPVHKALLGAGVVVVESVDLAGVDPGPYRLAVLPLLVPGSDGAPARAVLLR